MFISNPILIAHLRGKELGNLLLSEIKVFKILHRLLRAGPQPEQPNS